MDDNVKRALQGNHTIEITTIGRVSGRPHRIEIGSHNVDGRVYLSGWPGHRDWYANLLAHPDFTFHVKEGAHADLPARAEPILDEGARRHILSKLLQQQGSLRDLEAWVASSPLVEVHFNA